MHLLKTITQNSKKVSIYSLSAVLAVAAVATAFHPEVAHAGTLSQVMVRFNRIQTSQQTTGTVCAKPATTNTEASVQVVFPTGYTLGAAATFTVSNTANPNWPSGATGWLTIGTASNVTSQTVTFPSGDLTVGTLYCFDWTNSAAVKVNTSVSSTNTGSVTTQTSAPATIDTANYVTVSVAADQINVSAQIPQSFSYAINNTSDNLGSLVTGSVNSSPSPRQVTINTNAANGWMLWGQDLNATPGLHSAAGNYTIGWTTPGTNSTISGSTEGYNMGAQATQTSGTGTLTVAAPFVGGSSGKGGGLDGTLRTVVSSTGTANGAVVTLTNNVTLSATTTAATDYADTITLPAAAMF